MMNQTSAHCSRPRHQACTVPALAAATLACSGFAVAAQYKLVPVSHMKDRYGPLDLEWDFKRTP